MKRFSSLVLIGLVASLVILFISAGFAANQSASMAALNLLKTTYPQIGLYQSNDQIGRIYGSPFSFGVDALASAELFRLNYSPIFGVDPGDLAQVSAFNDKLKTQQLMYDSETGQYKFTLVYYAQQKNGIPVFRSELRLLVRNEANYPLVWAGNTLKNIGDFKVDQTISSVDPNQVQRTFVSRLTNMANFSQPRLVIWAGLGESKVTPILGVEFVADNGIPATEKMLYIVDPVTGEVLFEENKLIDVNVTGQVNGLATENNRAEQCGNEVATGLPYARVSITGGNSAYANQTGAYTITNSGSTAVTVTSQIFGHWFRAINQAGSNSQLSLSVTPPGPANFLHNPANAEYTRAEVNAYLHANIVRDYTLTYNPTYPTIYNQIEFPVYVNDNTGYCPGNAWYDGVSLTFCRAGSGYPNTAFSTVVHHEYGHHLVEMAGSGQDEYGEGMGDVMGMLITDNPGAAIGFFGDCVDPLRSGDNTMQYPCSGAIHYCGQLLSGCVWSTRNQLAANYPTTYRSIISNLAINAMLLHTGGGIAPDITIDYLTLDDDDGNISNGTPHYSEICAGFNAHNMDCPALTLLAFNYPNGLPSLISPAGGTTVRVQVSALAGTPQPNTGQLHYSTGGAYTTVSMTQVSPNVYDAVFPAFTCRTNIKYYFSARTTASYTVNDPADAPTSYYSAMAATGITTIFSDNFSSNLGWTGMGGSGEWTISAATGGSGSDAYGGPDPSVDHTPTTDNGVLGNDNTSGTGGDYSPSLSTTYWVTSPVINCSGQTSIQLEFYRWLGVERNVYDHAYLQGYNGSIWVTIFENDTITIDESAWSYQKYDVSAVANNNANFRIRFGIGPTDGAWEFCGWNIDDLRVFTIDCNATTGTISGIVSDNSGALANAIVVANDGAGHIGRDTTSASGAYSIAILAGTYDLSFSHSGYKDTTRTGIQVAVGGTTTVNMVMRSLPGNIRGIVTTPGTQEISNVLVLALGSLRGDTTDALGRYLVTDINPGFYQVNFSHPAYFDTFGFSTITAGDTAVLNMIMISRCVFTLGDINGDGLVQASDITYGVRFLKGFGLPPPDSCFLDSTGDYIYAAGDVNGSCEFKASDITRLVSYFKGNAALEYCHLLQPPLAKIKKQTGPSLGKNQ